MPFKIVDRLLTEAATWRPKPIVQFSGFGEPTLYPHLVDAVTRCQEKGLRCYFYTNGMAMTPALTKKLVKAGLTWFLITVDGRDKETFEKIRAGLNFETVEHNVKEAWKICRNSNTKMRLGCVICEENKHDVVNIKKHWRSFAHRYDTWGEIPLVPGRVKHHAAIECRRKPWQQLLVRANGDIPFCCIDVTDEHSNVGNIYKHTMLKIFNSSEFNSFRKRVTERKNMPEMCKKICFLSTGKK